ncbi:MAG: glycosyl transferase family 90 [Bacteroidales bacterium]
MDKDQKEYILSRVNYYNKLSDGTGIPVGKAADGTEMVSLDKLKLDAVFNGKRSHSVYVFDTYEYTRFFNQRYKAGFLFGDITETPLTPSFVKSRPTEGNNANSILLPLNKIRHFTFVNDARKYTDKKNMLIGRAFVNQPHRKKFWEMYFGHPMCDLGNINKNLPDHPEWLVSPTSVDDHLEYKFILCLEGNDVASNLKWVMSSNSLAVMPKPKYESWYMEDHLIPDYHYVEIKPDYSNLEERLNYYIDHSDEAQVIINNAHKYVSQFQRKKIERIIGLMVVNKYFICTGQEKDNKIL